MNSINILIIDDEINLTRSLAFTLRQAGFSCIETHNGYDGCKLAKKQNPDVVLLDVRMPGMSGLEVLEWMLEEMPDTPVIMMSAFDDTQDAVNAMKLGAADYLSKPFDVDELILLIKDTNSQRQLKSEVRYFREKNSQNSAFLGLSPTIRNLREKLDRISTSKVKTVLLLGETGVGKSVIARDLHFRSNGKDAPFVEINCATLPENQIEAELFGAERGAVPGIISKRRGLVEIADGGTLFLDEIGEMPLSVQSKLLTFLESRSYRPMGIIREHFSDVRVIASTNSNLEKAVEDGLFRQDLLFRLKVMPIEIPPLRDREKDIKLLSLYFAKKFSDEAGNPPIRFPSNIQNILESYDWPGNVRELKNLIERLTILYPKSVITEDQLPIELRDTELKRVETIEESMINVERALVRDALTKCQGKKGLAADRLGISRHSLKRRMQKLDLT